jgi:hypothetical protein
MIWKFAKSPRFAGGMVVPLSLAYSSTRAIVTLRREMERLHIDLRFMFFDRTPDSLFGDDVKTRNTIVLVSSSSAEHPTVETSSLYRWSSTTRGSLFKRVPGVRLAERRLAALIPKVGSEIEEMAYTTLCNNRQRLGASQSRAALGNESALDHTIYFSTTAYNWLPVLRRLQPPSEDERATASHEALRAIRFRTPQLASLAFAVISSRLAYWLWRVVGDGFHLTQAFVENLPIDPLRFSMNGCRAVEELSAQLWSEMQNFPTMAINGGVARRGYSPLPCVTTRTQIDAVLVDELGLPRELSERLIEFERETVSAGRSQSEPYARKEFG